MAAAAFPKIGQCVVQDGNTVAVRAADWSVRIDGPANTEKLLKDALAISCDISRFRLA
jgi:hypothetical protein